MTMTIRSGAFEAGKPIPAKYTGDGADLSPPLAWDHVPAGVQEFALICDDPDAPRKDPWVHWILYKIPATARSLPEGVPRTEKLDTPVGARQGVNSWSSDNIGYRGPKPPSGVHRYFFKLYALDAPLDVGPKLDKAALLKAMQGHVLAEAEVMGTYAAK